MSKFFGLSDLFSKREEEEEDDGVIYTAESDKADESAPKQDDTGEFLKMMKKTLDSCTVWNVMTAEMIAHPKTDLADAWWGATNGNYMISAYRCPRCGGVMYKTVFPEGRDPILFIGAEKKKYIEPARVFVCPCGRFMAVPKGVKISNGTVMYTDTIDYSKPDPDRNLFEVWLKYFNYLGDINARRNE